MMGILNLSRADEVMKSVADLIPWKVTDISFRPFKGFFSFNPSLHRDGDVWRCTIRCSDYALFGGREVRSSKAKPGEARTKNAMVIFDPHGWRSLEIYKIRERDDLPRAASSSVGYEDIRLFRTDQGGLQGIAASLHLRRDDRSRKPLAEQVLLSFDENYDIVAARPIRGHWSTSANKNWAPFDNCTTPRFLYAIEEGLLFDAQGPNATAVVPSMTTTRLLGMLPPVDKKERARERALEAEDEHETRDGERGKWKIDLSDIDARGSSPLRGGTQLVRVGVDTWLGIGHAMKFVDKKLKFYHHVWYLVDDHGKTKAVSPPCKLASANGIEFAAGLAIDGDRVVVSFGVDDGECKIGETQLSAVMEILR